MKILSIIFRSILIAILTLFLAGYILFYTQMGSRFSFHQVNKIIPELTYDRELIGKLGSHFILNNLHLISNGNIIKIDQLEVFWSPVQFIHGKLPIDFLRIKNLTVYHTPKKTETTNDIDPWLKRIILKNADITNIKIYNANKLTTEIARIFTTKNSYTIQLAKGIMYGEYEISDDKWSVTTQGIDVDSNYLYKNTNAFISFQALANGIWAKRQNNFHFELSNLVGKISEYPIQATAKLDKNNNDIAIGNIDFNVANSFIKISGIAGEKWDVKWNIHLPNLTELHKSLKGSIESNGKILTVDKSPLISASLTANNLSLNPFHIQNIKSDITSDFSGNTTFTLDVNRMRYDDYVIPNTQTKAKLQFLNNTLTIASSSSFSKFNGITSNITVYPNFSKSLADYPIKGSISLLFKQINELIKIKRTRSLQGLVTGNIKLNGSLLHPKANGTFTLSNGSLNIKRLGIQPRAIQANAIFNQTGIINLNGNLLSGNGNLNFKGNINLNKQYYPLQLAIMGNQFQLYNTDEYKVAVSPQLNLTVAGENATITGNVLIPYVHIALEDYNQIVTLPTEFVFKTEKPGVKYFKKFDISMQLVLGNNAYLAYQDLKATLAGRVFVHQVPGGYPSGRGYLLIKEGTYQVYDKTLSITDGRLIYAGNLLENPGLSIRAMKSSNRPTKNFLGFQMANQNNAMKVGVSVTGTLENPIVDLVSVPPMNQTDILSHMIFGQSTANISGLDALSLLGTISTNLNVPGTTQADPQTANDDVLGIFKMGLLNPIQALNLALPISNTWRIQTETNLNEIGADILYSYDQS